MDGTPSTDHGSNGICPGLNVEVVLDEVLSLLATFDQVYNRILKTTNYHPHDRITRTRDTLLKAHDDTEAHVLKLRGYVDTTFDNNSLLPWWHELGPILGGIALGEEGFRDDMKDQLKTLRETLQAWIATIEQSG